MSRTSLLIVLGVLTTLTPVSGLPIAIRSPLMVVFGACITIVGLLMRSTEADTARAHAEASLQTAEPGPAGGVESTAAATISAIS